MDAAPMAPALPPFDEQPHALAVLSPTDAHRANTVPPFSSFLVNLISHVIPRQPFWGIPCLFACYTKYEWVYWVLV
jgi:hypothetical protein